LKRILLISDLHIPAHHNNSFNFIKKLVKDIKPTKVIIGGDEINNASFSFYDKHPEMPGVKEELALSIESLKQLAKIIPKADLLIGNHTELINRKMLSAGIPDRLLKSYHEYLETPKTWKYHNELCMVLPNGQECKAKHKISKNILRASQMNSISMIQFHYHTRSAIEYWSNGKENFFAMTCGCLIDDKNMAFQYNKKNINRPVLSCAAIIESIPHIIPMNI
jgi:UDP-2,3-diacylglucosamine pyrophosphatase LpxH